MNRIVSTLYFPARAAWADRVVMIDRSTLSPVQLLRRLVSESANGSILVLDGAIGARGFYLDRVAAAIANCLGRAPVVITDCTWRVGRSRLGRMLRRAAIQVMDGPRTTYCVLSRDEERTFAVNWGVSADRVARTPFYYTLPEDALAIAPSSGGGVFTGGDALRDYRTLVAAVAPVTAPVRIAARHCPPDVRRAAPAHVQIGPVPPELFLRQMAAATVVVVPLQGGLDRSAGQQTYLNAMALGKAVVVTDAPGVRDHVEHGETGIVVPPNSPEQLRSALSWALEPAHREQVEALGARARERVLVSFGPDAYVESLLAVLDSVSSGAPLPRQGADLGGGQG